MTEASLELFLELATSWDAPISDGWSCSSIRRDRDIDLQELNTYAEQGYRVVGFFGSDRHPIAISDGPPDPYELGNVASLAPNERVQAEVLATRSGIEAAELLIDELVEVEVRIEREGWARTAEAFYTAVDARWDAVAETMPVGGISIGDVRFDLEEVRPRRKPSGSLPVLMPTAARPDGEAGIVWDASQALADAAAWTNIAVEVDRSGGSVLVALHGDQDTDVSVVVGPSKGGCELLRWVVATDDANRDEALRYVLRLVTAGAPHHLPDARTVKKLAERQRIAFARERAAEVQRAIADSHRDTAEALRAAAADLGDLVEETTKTANASIVAILGLVAFLAKDSDRLPGWLVVLATLAAVLGVLLVGVSRWRRIDDQETAVERLLERLRNDPLLPEEDMHATEASVADFDLSNRSRKSRQAIAVLGGASCLVVLSAAGWLLLSRSPTPAPKTPVSTTAPPSTAPRSTSTSATVR